MPGGLDPPDAHILIDDSSDCGCRGVVIVVVEVVVVVVVVVAVEVVVVEVMEKAVIRER